MYLYISISFDSVMIFCAIISRRVLISQRSTGSDDVISRAGFGRDALGARLLQNVCGKRILIRCKVGTGIHTLSLIISDSSEIESLCAN